MKVVERPDTLSSTKDRVVVLGGLLSVGYLWTLAVCHDGSSTRAVKLEDARTPSNRVRLPHPSPYARR